MNRQQPADAALAERLPFCKVLVITSWIAHSATGCVAAVGYCLQTAFLDELLID
jgi:hypothetical protein